MTPVVRTPTPGSTELPPDVRQSLLRLRLRAWGFASGFVLGVALFAATLFLVLRGGTDVGKHLGLLSVFLPGYSVTVAGSFIGFIYAFIIGYAFGWIAARLYSAFARAA